MKLDPKTGRPADYQLFSMTTYICEGQPTRHCLGRRRKKDLRYHFHHWIEVFRDEDYVIAEHEYLPGRFVEALDDNNWRFVPSWKGTFEAPKCISSKPLDVSFMIRTVPA